MVVDILNIALKEVGVKEVAGNQDNPEVLKYFNILGFDGKKLHDETAWCSAFANWVAKKAGYEFTGKLTARSWMKAGVSTENPKQGDVVVFWREHLTSWKGHVAFFIKETKDKVYVLGGNQNNQVKISAYPKNRVLSYRKLHKI